MLGKPTGEGLTEEVSLTAGAEAQGGNGLLMGPDDAAAEACAHVKQPNHAPKARGCQHIPALLMACLGDHREGCPGHGEELLRKAEGRNRHEQGTGGNLPGGLVWGREEPNKEKLAGRLGGERLHRSPERGGGGPETLASIPTKTVKVTGNRRLHMDL